MDSLPLLLLAFSFAASFIAAYAFLKVRPSIPFLLFLAAVLFLLFGPVAIVAFVLAVALRIYAAKHDLKLF